MFFLQAVSLNKQTDQSWVISLWTWWSHFISMNSTPSLLSLSPYSDNQNQTSTRTFPTYWLRSHNHKLVRYFAHQAYPHRSLTSYHIRPFAHATLTSRCRLSSTCHKRKCCPFILSRQSLSSSFILLWYFHSRIFHSIKDWMVCGLTLFSTHFIRLL